ncbi:MAG: hypothetical protein ACRCX2_34660 [Paraclostridium sp.]
MSKFFKEFLRSDFLQEKTASEEDAIKSTLDTITPDVLEKLAEEIGVMIDQSPAMTLEEKLAEEGVEERKGDLGSSDSAQSTPKQDASKHTNEESTTSDIVNKPDKSKEEPTTSDIAGKSEPTATEASDKEDDTEEDKKEEEEKKDEPTSPEASDCEEKKEEDCKEDDKEEKEASEEVDFEMIKEAYELAEEKLASQGFTALDYVFNKTANEEMACFITDKAEKLAFLSDRPTLMVADEILGTISEKLG